MQVADQKLLSPIQKFCGQPSNDMCLSYIKVASTSAPPVLKPRYDNALFCIAIWAVIKHSIGILFSIFILILLLIFIPFVLAFRYLQIIRYRSQTYPTPSIRHCDVCWPLHGEPAKIVLTLQTTLNVELYKMQMNNILKLEETQCWYSCFGRANRNTSTAGSLAIVDVWDQKKARLKTVEDLIAALNDGSSYLINIKPQSVHTMIVPVFSTFNERKVSLAIITHPIDHYPHCLLRLLSLYTDGRLVFDIEPKMGESFTPGQNSCSLCSKLAQIIQFICIGPISIVSLALRKRSFLWSELSNLQNVPTAPVHRVYDTNADETILMETVGNDASKSLSNRHVYRWLRIPQTDQISRAERILRAASIELYMAFVAGTLRRHFRFLDIKHPTDIAAVVPISYREFIPVEAQKPCDTMLLPVQIPCGVEGSIPRIWAIQRRLAGVIEGVLPMALRVSRFLCDISLSPNASRSLFSNLYADCCVVISLFRTSGDIELDSHRIHSILLYPSIPSTVKAAFTFVQSGSDVMLSLSVCQQYFPNPDKLLSHFKTEVLCLLDQLAMRLLTLSQTTFLPVHLPYLCEIVDETNKIGYMKSAEEPSSTPTKESPDQMDVSELQQFISNIQEELDDLRTSRNANQIEKEEYVKKLTELEIQMKVFHDNMARRLGSPNLATLKEDAELASGAVAELLAPYREENGSARRFSREFHRTDMIRHPSESNIPW